MCNSRWELWDEPKCLSYKTALKKGLNPGDETHEAIMRERERDRSLVVTCVCMFVCVCLKLTKLKFITSCVILKVLVIVSFTCTWRLERWVEIALFAYVKEACMCVDWVIGVGVYYTEDWGIQQLV